MKMNKLRLISLGAALAMVLPFSVRAGGGGNSQSRSQPVGGVFTMDNSPDGNNVWAFGRFPDGSLSEPVVYPTDGLGSGDALGNQGSIQLTGDGRWLLVCNAGTDDISVFAVTRNGLVLSDRVESQGSRPISLAVHGRLVYVLNAGGAVGGVDGIAGFMFLHGVLVPLPGAVYGLSADNTGPAQVAITSDGQHVVVTEKATALIDVFRLRRGLATGVNLFESPAPPPFGFAAGRRNRIFVTQAAGGAGNPGASSVSSYSVTKNGGLQGISDSIPTGQTAACWIVLTGNERYAYTANTPNDSISSFSVGPDGSLDLLESQAALTGTGSGPVDMALSRNSRFLYSLNPGNGSISGFAVNPGSGALAPLSGGGVPMTANGLAAQ